MTEHLNTADAMQAARWFAVRRRNVGSLEEREKYRRWTQEAANAKALMRLHALWADLGEAYSTQERPDVGYPWMKVIVAIGCVAAATLGSLCWTQGPFWTSLEWTTR